MKTININIYDEERAINHKKQNKGIKTKKARKDRKKQEKIKTTKACTKYIDLS